MKRTRCEVYSRVVGYLRPVDHWNAGKQAEFEDRKIFEVKNGRRTKQSNEKIHGNSERTE